MKSSTVEGQRRVVRIQENLAAQAVSEYGLVQFLVGIVSMMIFKYVIAVVNIYLMYQMSEKKLKKQKLEVDKI